LRLSPTVRGTLFSNQSPSTAPHTVFHFLVPSSKHFLPVFVGNGRCLFLLLLPQARLFFCLFSKSPFFFLTSNKQLCQKPNSLFVATSATPSSAQCDWSPRQKKWSGTCLLGKGDTQCLVPSD